MAWITLDESRVLADFPTDLLPTYQTWVADHPDKAGRLAQIISQIVAEFRDAISTNPASTLDPIKSKIPESCVRSAEVLIWGTLQIEMGVKMSSDDSQAMTRAEILLRQVGYGKFNTGTNASTNPASPRTGSRREQPERALP